MDAILYVKNVLDLIVATNLIQTLLFLNIQTCLDIYPMFYDLTYYVHNDAYFVHL
ncbi:unnamed protein product [Paramecium pentaurelia]|uniref:Uncharacterized protein n=1 Tax=Paramecium pentaurelia TaxID=43138 RepID=A0A8S1ULX5_9CILI|nr:unnamed protein product [Paramecium pentaurelia]